MTRPEKEHVKQVSDIILQDQKGLIQQHIDSYIDSKRFLHLQNTH